jgi:hypothetical protein
MCAAEGAPPPSMLRAETVPISLFSPSPSLSPPLLEPCSASYERGGGGRPPTQLIKLLSPIHSPLATSPIGSDGGRGGSEQGSNRGRPFSRESASWRLDESHLDPTDDPTVRIIYIQCIHELIRSN